MFETATRATPHSAPTLLVELAPWPHVFFGNLRDILPVRSLPPLQLHSAPAPFWPDVFVKRGLPWGCFFESGALHVLAFTLLLLLSRFLTLAPQPVPRATFNHAQVIYYQPEEYLPPVNTLNVQPAPVQKAVEQADPAFAPQPIISVPREPDNRSQTIVTPPGIKLKQDVPLPNVVAWTNRPELPIAPAPVMKASAITRLTPQLENSVVAPPPDAERNRQRDLPPIQTAVVAPPPDIHAPPNTAFKGPQPAVIEPPPSVEAASRPLGDLNIAPSSVIAPAPQLSVREQRAIPGGASAQATLAPQVVPPPPSVSQSGSSTAGGRIVALNLHPSVALPPDPPQGNRRGTFATTPEGHVGASANPGSSTADASVKSGTYGAGSGNSPGTGNGSSKDATGGLPSGLYVGSGGSSPASPVTGDPAPKNPSLTSSNPTLIAKASPARPLPSGNVADLSEPEQEVFASRKFYSMTLNMPNLNSAGGTWVIRFTELKRDSSTGELSAPLVLHKVDPGYPLQIMRENVSGNVILYAVIHADGSVGNVRILRSVDDRLDRFASQAVAQWRFQPATKDGTPVDVEATFKIPFRPGRRNF